MSKEQVLDKGIRQKSIKRVNSFYCLQYLLSGATEPWPHRLRETIVCIQVKRHAWRVDKAPTKTHKNQNASVDALQSAVLKINCIYTPSDANWLKIHQENEWLTGWKCDNDFFVCRNDSKPHHHINKWMLILLNVQKPKCAKHVLWFLSTGVTCSMNIHTHTVHVHNFLFFSLHTWSKFCGRELFFSTDLKDIYRTHITCHQLHVVFPFVPMFDLFFIFLYTVRWTASMSEEGKTWPNGRMTASVSRWALSQSHERT